MLRFGKISKIDAEKGQYQVTFDEDQLVSGWLFANQRNTKDNKDEVGYAMDEHVSVHMDDNMEYGVILGAIYDAKNKPTVKDAKVRATTFKDGSVIKFNTENGEWEMQFTKLTLNEGENGGIPMTPQVKAQLNKIENKLNDVIDGLNAVVVPLAPSGSYALSADFATVLTLENTTDEDIANPDFLQ